MEYPGGFAANPSSFKNKSGYVHKLMATHDVGLWTETHGAAGGNAVWKKPIGCQSWWAPGPATAVAGVGIVVKNEFFALFDPLPTWTIIMPGRAARFRLRGPLGNLDAHVMYFRAG